MMNPGRLIGLRVRTARESGDLTQGELAELVAATLRPDVICGQKLRELRDRTGYTQEELANGVLKILGECRSSGIPDRMAASKVETGKRSLEFLEGLAAAIVLGVDPWSLAPDELAEIRPRLKLGSLWILVKWSEDHCYEFKHTRAGRLPATVVGGWPLKLESGVRHHRLLELFECNGISEYDQRLIMGAC